MERPASRASRYCVIPRSSRAVTRRLKEELSTAKKEAIHWSNKYHDLWYDVKPYLDALHRAPELVRGFLEKILAPKQERTMNVPQRNCTRGQDIEL